ncbi:MAG: alanine dehydrogenase [Clostridiales bacterium]|nr:alanine dehydrogenase [Clostridiales bacterium]
MLIGVPKEIMQSEDRVSITPAGVFELKNAGHNVLVQKGAGIGSGFSDKEYTDVGAELTDSSETVFKKAELIVKVKQPFGAEYDYMPEGQAVFTYFHLAPNPELTRVLVKKKITAIAYETVELPNGQLPLLSPMSEVAGRMSIQIGAYLLQKNNHGSGILLGGVPGVKPAEVLIIGGGVVGINAAKMAVGLGARVTLMDINKARLSQLDDIFAGRISTVLYNTYDVAYFVRNTDLLIGAVLVTGSRAPKTVTEDMVKSMREGSVIVDVAIDQGGTIETADRITTHDDPYYVKHGVVHYSVANMPGAVARTSTFALSGATLPYVLMLANRGVLGALQDNVPLYMGLNTYKGHVTYKGVADALNMEYCDPATLI